MSFLDAKGANFKVKNFIFLLVIILAGCSSLPKYVAPPASENPATVLSYSNLLFCKLSGIKGPNGYNSCQARLLAIDGLAVSNSQQVKVSPGVRQVTTFCHAIDFSYSLPGSAPSRKPDKSHSQKYEVEFFPGEAYKVEPFWDGNYCRVRLIDAAGNELPMKHATNPVSP